MTIVIFYCPLMILLLVMLTAELKHYFEVVAFGLALLSCFLAKPRKPPGSLSDYTVNEGNTSKASKPLLFCWTQVFNMQQARLMLALLRAQDEKTPIKNSQQTIQRCQTLLPSIYGADQYQKPRKSIVQCAKTGYL